MTLETFFEKFDLFADAPDAVAKMRELVLQLAVQGKLVDQKRSDGNAAQLLAAISSERDARAAKLRIPNEPASADGNDHAFPIPSNWTWTQLGNIALQIQYGYTASADPNATEIRMLRITDIQNNGVDWPSVPGCQIESAEAEKYLLSPNDILIARTGGTIGKSFIVPDPPVKSVFASYLIRITPPQSMVARYLKSFLESPLYWSQLRQMSAGTGQPNVNGQALGRLEIPLPPNAEQKRIVAKVDELMALCDRLEAQQQERETRHAALARASLARFADAPTPANLHFLFHSSFNIHPSDLRKSILTLAVQGKLVPQDPNDEPAHSILRATQSLFQRLVAAKKLSSPKPLPPIEDGEVPFSLPSGWEWCRLGQVMRMSSGDGLIAKNMNDGPYPVYGGNGVNGYHDEHNVAKRTLVIGRVGFYCGSIHVTPEMAWVTDNAFITTFDEEHVDMDFLSWLLKATDLRERDNATAQPVISGGKVYPTILALPPLAEQRRIVAKVEQLMALVDALEAQLAASRATAANLLSALVAELASASANGAAQTSPGQRPGKTSAKPIKG